jgi:hypothetical protein
MRRARPGQEAATTSKHKTLREITETRVLKIGIGDVVERELDNLNTDGEMPDWFGEPEVIAISRSRENFFITVRINLGKELLEDVPEETEAGGDNKK